MKFYGLPFLSRILFKSAIGIVLLCDFDHLQLSSNSSIGIIPLMSKLILVRAGRLDNYSDRVCICNQSAKIIFFPNVVRKKPFRILKGLISLFC